MWFAQVAEPVVTSVNYTTVETSGGLWAAVAAWWFLWMIVMVVMIVAYWKIFVKAGEAGWKSLIPFYNTYLLFQIAGRNGLWFLLLFVPIANIIAIVVLSLDLARSYGKSPVFGIFGLLLFPYVGYLMLGFDSSTYVGTKHQ